MLPGQITACPDQSGYKLSYTFPSGGSLSFSTENTAGWLFVSGQQSRLKMSMVLNPPQIPSDYFGPNGLTSSPNTVADKEVKLSFANGDILFFRRSAQFDAASGCRPLVPVEKKMAGGYSQNFDYTSVAVSEPIKVRDSLNRELQLTWADAGSISSSLGGYTSGPESSATTGMAAQKN